LTSINLIFFGFVVGRLAGRGCYDLWSMFGHRITTNTQTMEGYPY
jgi:hypothetical protein